MSHQSNPDQLWYAARNGNVALCLDLLWTHQNTPGYVDHQSELHGTTPLCCALEHCHRRFHENDVHLGQYLLVVECLLQHGADVSVVCEDGSTALHWAVRAGFTIDYMQMILKNSPYLDVNVKVDGKTPLMTVVSSTCDYGGVYRGQVLALLAHGAEVDTVDMYGNSLLHQICTVDDWMLSTLIQYNVDINLKCMGRTPLHHAIHESYDTMYWAARDGNEYVIDTETVETLLSHGANVYIEDNEKRTAEELAVSLFPRGHPILNIFEIYGAKAASALAFASGTHRRNYADCLVKPLPPEIVKIVHGYL
jgi:ankyrin repeat protein